MELLILLAVLLTVVAVAKVLKAKELVDGFKDPESDPISPAEVKSNALGWLIYGIVFFALTAYMFVAWQKYLLPSSASEHGVEIDNLFKVTMGLIIFVFYLTHAALFWFVYKYHYKKGQKAFWFPHDNKLEMAWTVIPASVLILLITYGLNTWSDSMYPEVESDAVRLEIVSEQFKWTARYAGEDQQLGEATFALYGKNALGVATKFGLEDKMVENEKTIQILVKDSARLDSLIQHDWNQDEKFGEVRQSLKNYRTNKSRINRMLAQYDKDASKFDAGEDDQVINSDSIYLPKGRQVIMQFRSKDVIHSAYLPHFRVQMNAVPGMKTGFTFTPKYTNAEMNEVAIGEGRKFTGYILLCNKICGASHFNMKLHVKVVEPEVYDKWIASQTKFKEAYQ